VAAATPLLLVLVLQSVFTLRLSNTAFQDEALYLYAGHREIASLLHGTPTYDNYASYFSGAPLLYPVLAAAVDGVFGLQGARLLSTLFLLGTTWLLHGMTRRLFGGPAALAAAALFALSAPTLFVGHLATYDAPALFLLALAAWIVVRTAPLHWSMVGLAAPVLTLAGATKYAALLFAPSIVVLGMLADPLLHPTSRRAWRFARPMLRSLLVVAMTIALSLVLLRLAGPSFTAGLRATTTARHVGTDSTAIVLAKSATWGGPLFLVALGGALLLMFTRRSTSPTWLRILLASLLTLTALLAPAYQVHLHTLVSLHKHIDFGLFFAAPLAGLAVARLLGAGLRNMHRLAAALGVCLLVAGSGLASSSALYREWPNASAMIGVLRSQVRPVTGRYLVEESEVPRYYLASLAEPYQWTGTYFFSYKGQVGEAAYRAAIADRFFDVVVFRYGPTASLDHAVDADLVAERGYELIARVPYTSGFGAGTYSIWRAVR
jgi:4-amino-4-deoxy-L-arabinose transferase-like glycosyltransferase